VIAAPGATPRIAATGNASLASAGTGDVLAGWMGGRWAGEGAGGDAAADAIEVATASVVAHGAAAEPERPGPIRAGDLIEAMYQRSRVYRRSRF
jgi:NAD(P)H-hydrate repair Nnr-like enzyme with NAD(P)H-hydrate dehydratase domain